MTLTSQGSPALPLRELRRLRDELWGPHDGRSPSGAGAIARRLVPVGGTGPAGEISVGDLAIVSRSRLGRRSLVRLADELALRGAAGLILSEEIVAPLPADLRRSI